MLYDLTTLADIFLAHPGLLNYNMYAPHPSKREKGTGGEIGLGFCSECWDERKALLRVLYAPEDAMQKMFGLGRAIGRNKVQKEDCIQQVMLEIVPTMFIVCCAYCTREHLGILLDIDGRPSLVVYPVGTHGFSTEHTPLHVQYYLDQAVRASSAGAMSAAVVMYRSAIEGILHDQGYREDKLYDQIGHLRDDMLKGKAPTWAQYIGEPFLDALRDCGNAAVHANEGNIEIQSAFDVEFVTLLNKTLQAWLYAIYEEPINIEKKRKLLADRLEWTKKGRPC
ncbi:MAG: DUF4145 domain-containing protein [Phycisphaeraceae bacterium]|nr:DUF4145 domain-containing protein [Phycisphaeraceae bacterium]